MVVHLKTFGVFFSKLSKIWWASMSCAAFTLFSVFLAVVNRSGSWLIGGTVLLAIFFLVVAAYRVWVKENEARLNAETELGSAADIQGQIHARIMDYDPWDEIPAKNSGMKIFCDCANHGRKTCEISKMLVVIVTPGPQGVFKFMHVLEQKDIKWVQHGENFRSNFELRIPTVPISRLQKSQISLFLVDSLGIEYHNTQLRLSKSSASINLAELE